MREPQYSILVDIQDAIERAKQGKLALYWQRTIQREYRCKKVTPAEQQAYEQLQSILSEVPQWSGEEDLRHNMENIGGRVWFCHFWIDHHSMVQLTEATASLLLPMCWTRTLPRRCAGRLHCWHGRSLRTAVCRNGALHCRMRLSRTR
jgi:hypothetical protein